MFTENVRRRHNLLTGNTVSIDGNQSAKFDADGRDGCATPTTGTHDRKERTSRRGSAKNRGRAFGGGLGTELMLDELPMGSVVYVGRGSFRMEAISIADEDVNEEALGIAQPITSVVTAPRSRWSRATPWTVADQTRTSGEWQGPRPVALFGSQDDMPVLAAPPTGSGRTKRPRLVLLPQAALLGLGSAVFACGLLAGERPARSPWPPSPSSRRAALRPSVVAPARPAVAAPATAAPAAVVLADAATTADKGVVTIEVPESVKIPARINVRKRTAACGRASAPETKQAAAKAWGRSLRRLTTGLHAGAKTV